MRADREHVISRTFSELRTLLVSFIIAFHITMRVTESLQSARQIPVGRLLKTFTHQWQWFLQYVPSTLR